MKVFSDIVKDYNFSVIPLNLRNLKIPDGAENHPRF